MAKDYAKRVFTTSRKPKKKGWRTELIIVAALLFLIGYWAYRHPYYFSTPEAPFWDRVKAFASHQSMQKPAQKEKILTQPKQVADVHFDFYNELPNMKVTLPESNNESVSQPVPKIHDPEAPVSPKAASPQPVYILQLGVFNDAIGAKQLRLSLLLSGCEAEVVTIKSEEGLVYRVQRGPFVSQAEAKKLQRQLEKKGITCVLKKA